MMILLSAVKSDSEDICTMKPFKRPSETDARSSNDIKLQFLASYGRNSQIKQEWKWVHQCTASVLTKRTLLTAAHCLRKFDQEKNSVVVGADDLNSDTGLVSGSRQDITISRVVRHPDYDDVTAYYDVAIIHTDEDIQFDDGVKPACLSNLTSKSTDFLHNEVTKINVEKFGFILI